MTTHPLAKKGRESLSIPQGQLQPADVRRMMWAPQTPSSLSLRHRMGVGQSWWLRARMAAHPIVRGRMV